MGPSESAWFLPNFITSSISDGLMKVVILAGGFGTRISEESHLRPKPMIEIGGKPILWHIMKIYSRYGFNDFIICGGYKQEAIKEYFEHYYLLNCDVEFDLSTGDRKIINSSATEPWKVTVVDTGLNTMTGGRIKRIRKLIGDEPFMLTYGDGVSDVDISELVRFHKARGKIVTLTAVQMGSRFGNLDISNEGDVRQFSEKKKEYGSWINGGFMVIEPKIFEYIEGDSTVFELGPLEKIAKESELAAYRHEGFWKCMDTLRDKTELETLVNNKEAPWITW